LKCSDLEIFVLLVHSLTILSQLQKLQAMSWSRNMIMNADVESTCKQTFVSYLMYYRDPIVFRRNFRKQEIFLSVL
jgi:hypothetical protein